MNIDELRESLLASPKNGYARSRIAAQHDEIWFRERCQIVLENNGNLDAFATKCVAFLKTLGIIEPEN